MLNVKKEGVIVDLTDLEFENEGVLNPDVMQEGNDVHVFYRAVRKGNHSTIGYAKLSCPLKLTQRDDKPLLYPEFEYESQGIEDARIVKIEGLYYLTFTAYDGVNALGSLAVSNDLCNFKRLGIIVPQITYGDFQLMAECNNLLSGKYKRYHIQHIIVSSNRNRILLSDKNVMFFPRKINGKFYFLHRIKPDNQVASFNEIKDLNKAYWKDYFMHFQEHIAMSPKYEHEISYIGGGCPPIETKEGWLLIYHGVHDSAHGYVYTAFAALIDLEDPTKEFARLPYPLFKPEHDWVLNGEVNNVVFTTGTALYGDTLYVYYGAADSRIAAASFSLSQLVIELLNHPA